MMVERFGDPHGAPTIFLLLGYMMYRTCWRQANVVDLKLPDLQQPNSDRLTTLVFQHFRESDSLQHDHTLVVVASE